MLLALGAHKHVQKSMKFNFLFFELLKSQFHLVISMYM